MPYKDEEAIQKVNEWFKTEYTKKFYHDHLWKFIPSKLRRIRQDFLRKKSGWKTEEDFFSHNNTKG